MDEDTFREQIAAVLLEIHSQLVRSVSIQTEDTQIDRAIRDLEEKRTEATSGLLECSTETNTLAGQRTEMAKERTALAREQTRLSTKSTELSTIRTELSRERSSLASQRTNLAVLRTDFSRSRTSLADQRTKMAGDRTSLADQRTKMAGDRTRFSERRTNLAGTRTVLSNMRTALARGRTYLALIRTGLTFLTLSITLFRVFGVSWWTAFDGALAFVSLVMTVVGLAGYWRSARAAKVLKTSLPEEEQTAA